MHHIPYHEINLNQRVLYGWKNNREGQKNMTTEES